MRQLPALPLTLLLACATAACASDAGRFRHELVSANSATAVLQAHCPLPGDKLRAERSSDAPLPPPPSIRRALAARDGETIRHRRVRLLCGPAVFSDADNWYVPERLAPGMNATLEESDTPFGRVVARLRPIRRTLATKADHGQHFLSVTAVLIAANGQPISGVIEHYRRAVLVRDLRPAPLPPPPPN